MIKITKGEKVLKKGARLRAGTRSFSMKKMTQI